MKVVAFLSLVATGALITACSGYTNLGDGPAGAGGEDDGSGGSLPMGGSGGKGSGGSTPMGKAGSSMGGSVGTAGRAGAGGGMNGSGGSAGGMPMRQCDGMACGTPCAVELEPGAMRPAQGGETSEIVAASGYCTQEGSCEAALPSCSQAPCMTTEQCPATSAICEVCADGTLSCPSYVCLDGQCTLDAPGCNDVCETSMDCAAAVAPCQMCPDGETSCPTVECLMGRCVGNVPGCGDYDPCEGRACGDQCSPCEPGDMNCAAPAVITACNDAGICQAGIPSCGVDQCMTAMDCPQTDACYMCSDGGCGGVECVDGRCKPGCPNDPAECKATEDCGTPPPVCIDCGGGTCAQMTCVNGSCEMVCEKTACMSDEECPQCGACGNLTVCVPYTCVDNACELDCTGIGFTD
jgi:hypothetical protein